MEVDLKRTRRSERECPRG